MGGMERDQRQLPGLNAPDDLLGPLRLEVGMADMAPPDKDVRVTQHVRPKPLLLVIDANRLNVESRRTLAVLHPPQVIGDSVAQEVLISALLRGLPLIPYDNVYRPACCLRRHGIERR